MDLGDGRRFVVRLAVDVGHGGAVRRVRVRIPTEAAAGEVLSTLLRRTMRERAPGRTVRVERAPDDLLTLLAMCGLEAALPVTR